MARLTRLVDIRKMLRAEIGDSITPGVGIQLDPTLNQLLSNMQLWLADEYDWPFLEDRWDVPMVAAQRYYGIPTTSNDGSQNILVNTNRPFKLEVKYNSQWQDVEYGVGSEQFNYIDSDTGQVLDPVQRWRFSDEDTAKFEVWPIPATTGAMIMRWTGQRVPDKLQADADLANLDDLLLTLFCAAEFLSRRKQADAEIKLQKAQLRLARLRGTGPSLEKRFILGKNLLDHDTPRRGVPLVVVHG